MPVDLTGLNAAIEGARVEAARTKSTEESAGAVIKAQGTATAQAVADALKADGTVSQTAIDAAVAAANEVTKGFSDSDDVLAAAITAQPVP